MLHIITPLYRFNLLNKVYQSISNYSDIIWHISKSNTREEIPFDFVYNNEKIILYNVDCDDSDTTKKRNAIFKNITDGYFCFLDDDTIFHPNMYNLYQKKLSENYIGMVVGQQINAMNKPRLGANVPKINCIDTGNAFAHTSCLSKVSWTTKNVLYRDSIFWMDVYSYYNKSCELLNEPISIYNFLKYNK
jgi:hypothetical protein